LFIQGENKLNRGVSFNAETIIHDLQIRDLISNNGGISIYDSTINTHLDISQSKLKDSISIRKSNINGEVRLDNIEANSLDFIDSNFYKNLYSKNCNIKYLHFNNGVFYEEVSLSNGSITKDLSIVGTEFKRSLNFIFDKKQKKLSNVIQRIFIRSTKFKGQLIFHGKNIEIESLTIDATKQLEGEIYFKLAKIYYSKVTGDNYNSNIVFNHCEFNQLEFDFFYNYSTISLIAAKSFGNESKLKISHSNLGKTHLFDTDLTSFKFVEIYSSVLTNIVTANVKWFSDNKLNSNLHGDNVNFDQKREIYRQLKFALEKEGNRIDSLGFKALELKSFKQGTFSKLKWPKNIFNIDGLILFASQTNNFGANWAKPILFLLGLSLIFHFWIIIGLNENLSFTPRFNHESVKITFKIYQENFGALFQLISPTHLLSKIFPQETEISGSVYLIDLILKILNSFFIFQSISAFRKFIK
jgi:hypothetical protein